jgi:ABC-type phosphate/phosphonate transport system ATPase subunit
MITHEEDIAAYATRVIRLRDGRIVDDRSQSTGQAQSVHVAHARASAAPGPTAGEGQ